MDNGCWLMPDVRNYGLTYEWRPPFGNGKLLSEYTPYEMYTTKTNNDWYSDVLYDCIYYLWNVYHEN